MRRQTQRLRRVAVWEPIRLPEKNCAVRSHERPYFAQPQLDGPQKSLRFIVLDWDGLSTKTAGQMGSVKRKQLGSSSNFSRFVEKAEKIGKFV
jgi:hypothetical protein